MSFHTIWLSGGDTIDAEIIVQSAVELSTFSEEVIYSPIVDICNLASIGGLTSNATSTIEASIEDACISDDRIIISARMTGVDESILRNFYGAMQYFDENITLIKSVEFSASPALLSAKDAPAVTAERRYPFQFSDERQSFRSVQIQVELASPSEEIVQLVEYTAFGPWFCASSAGCFCSDQQPPSSVHLYLGEHVYGPDFIILDLEDIALPEPDAISSLLSSLCHFHYSKAKIKSVVLYD